MLVWKYQYENEFPVSTEAMENGVKASMERNFNQISKKIQIAVLKQFDMLVS